MSRVFILGLGEIGLNNAKYYIDNGCDVSGWDIDELARKVAKGLAGVETHRFLGDYDFNKIDVISISVSTKAVYEVASVLVSQCGLLELESKPLLIIESTVVPGTCQDILDNLFKNKLGIAHVPHRYWAVDPTGCGIRRRRLVSASDEDTLFRTIKFFRDVDMPLVLSGDLAVAEFAKVAENAYRNLQISYMEELFGVCSDLGIDFRAVKEAMESHENIGRLPEVREGVGGHCLPMAAEIMQDLSKYNDIITAAINADARYRKLIGEW